MKQREEFYVSVDVEANGPIPGDNAMLSFAAVAMDQEGHSIGEFEANLISNQDGTSPNEDTMKWWGKQSRVAQLAALNGEEEPRRAMFRFKNWLGHKGKTPVFVGYPAGYDFTFIYWYLMHHCGQSPFSFVAFDMKTAAALILGLRFRDTTKRSMPRKWVDESLRHTHLPIDDARGQAFLFRQILAVWNEKSYVLPIPAARSRGCANISRPHTMPILL